jgi:CHASE2 domain-containing sensor protein
LWIGAFFNFGAALMFIFPVSLGQIAGLPVSGSLFYNWLLALFIGLFGAVYAWLARRPRIDHPLVGLAIIGKMGVFAVALASWLLGVIPFRGFVVAIGDLVFGMIFWWWLRGELSGLRANRTSNPTAEFGR